jgi:hypothetical protein
MMTRKSLSVHVAIAAVLLIFACKSALPIIEAALTASQIACIATSTLTDAPALAAACAVDKALVPALLPVIENLIAQREAAAKAGVLWHGDAGAMVVIDGGRAADAGSH